MRYADPMRRAVWLGLLALSSGCSFVNDFQQFDFTDAGTRCSEDSDCDDGVACTTDVCAAGACEHRPIDAQCDDGEDGVCQPGFGCEYAGCNAETCTAGACERAMCNGAECVRASICDEGQSCCAGECVAAGCDDEIECTVDFCAENGCEHTPLDEVCDDENVCTDDRCSAERGCENPPNNAECDDGVFCNGADTCRDSACAVHEGGRCSGESVCDEERETCTGCVLVSDCPDPILGEWSVCDYEDVCDREAIRTRTVTDYECTSDGECVPLASTMEEEACMRDTEGVICEDDCFDGPCEPTLESDCMAVTEVMCDRRRCTEAGSCGVVVRESIGSAPCGTCDVSVGYACRADSGSLGTCTDDCMCCVGFCSL